MSQPLTKAFGCCNGYETDMKQAYGEIFANLASMNAEIYSEQRNGVRRNHKKLAKRRGFVTVRAPESTEKEILTRNCEEDCKKNSCDAQQKQNHWEGGMNNGSDKNNRNFDGKRQNHQKLRRLSDNKTQLAQNSVASLSGSPKSQSDYKLSLEDSDFSSISNFSITSSSGSESCFDSEVKTALNVIQNNMDQINPRQKSRIENTDVIYDDRMREQIAQLLETCDTSIERPSHLYKTIRTEHDILYVIKADV